jgi:hypothetical protein
MPFLCSPNKNLDKKLNNFLAKLFYFNKPRTIYGNPISFAASTMSRRVAPKKTSVATCFCKVCKDAGEVESKYTSHNVKDRNGKVCCPVLLATHCTNCGNLGHFKSYCTTVSFFEKLKRKAANASKTVTDARSTENKVAAVVNVYDDLMLSSDDEASPRTPAASPRSSAASPRTPKDSMKPMDCPWAPAKDTNHVKKVVRDWADYDSDDEW